jgi:hypothetical protein
MKSWLQPLGSFVPHRLPRDAMEAPSLVPWRVGEDWGEDA